MEHETFDFDREYRQNGLTLIVQGLTSQSTQFGSFRRWCFTGLMTQPTALKHWRSEVISHSDRPRSNQAHLTMLHWCNMHVDIIQENNLRHTKWCKDTEWTQWDGLLTRKLDIWVWTHPNGLFWETSPSNFYTCYRLTDGNAAPSKNFNGKHLKVGLKFKLCMPITLGLEGVTAENFSTWRAAMQAW